jgi:hypothetical protein
MPITAYLNGFRFDPETRRVMGVALEMTCAALKFANRTEISRETVAKKIIELAKEGMNDPDLLCERTLSDIREPSPRLKEIIGNIWPRIAFFRCEISGPRS